MKVCQVRNIRIGEGRPKVCLPIVGTTNEEIMAQLASFENLKYDLIELRIDFYKDVLDEKKVISILQEVRVSTAKPILLTLRSQQEGGEASLSNEDYKVLLRAAIMSRCLDLVDIELSKGDYIVNLLTGIAHRNRTKVILSSHDFVQTPDNDIIIQRIEKMQSLNADIAKIAVMPQDTKDVMRLLNLTCDVSEYLDIPLVTMSMGKLGVVSRTCGELTGSAMTFATAGKASAPGQINVQDMNIILKALHHD